MAVVSCIWSTLKSSGDVPSARSGHAIAVLNERVFLFGGSHSNNAKMQLQNFNDLYEARVENEVCEWQRKIGSGKIPQARDLHSMCAIENYLYVFGGRNEFQPERCINEVVRYDVVKLPKILRKYLKIPRKSFLDQNSWEEVTTRGPPPTAVDFSLGVVEKRAFVFGGIFEGRYIQDMSLFNFVIFLTRRKATEALYIGQAISRTASGDVKILLSDVNEWTPLRCKGQGPTPRCGHKCEVVDEVLFIFGGSEGPGRYCNDLYSFDTTLFIWTNVKCRGLPPAGRTGHSFVAHRDKDVYVFGGYGTFIENTCTTIVQKFSLGNQKWKQPLCAGNIPPMKSLYGHCAFILHSSMFILGGIGDQKITGFNYIYSLHFINPSFRKPVIEHMLNDFCKQSNSLACWLPTEQPPLSYTFGKSDEQLKKQLETFAKTSLNDTLPLSSEVIASEFDEAETLEAQRSLFEAAREELAQAKQVFENDRKQLIGLLERQRSEVQRLIDGHRKQNELWWKARIKENDDEREKLRLAWKDLEEEKVGVDQERIRLQQKANQVKGILQQLSTT